MGKIAVSSPARGRGLKFFSQAPLLSWHTLKHDYKNMMASLYLQSKKHDFGKLQENIQKMMDDFDENIDRKMNVNQQMSHLKHLELKSLLFQKITEIHKYNIPFHLEIFKHVREIPVEATDLVRIVGY